MLTDLDDFQIFAIVWETVQAIFIGIYYGQVGLPNRDYVSEMLFSDMAYKICMTIFVFVQMFLCMLYLYRFGLSVATVVGFLGAAAGVSGWLALNDRYQDTSGTTTFTHYAGLIVFLVGDVMYVAAMLSTLWDKIVHSCSPGHMVRNIIVYLVLAFTLATMAVGLVFLSGALANGIKDSWIYEHTAFMLFTITHVFLFMIVSPNPTRPVDLPERGVGYYRMGSVC